ncbi:MAG TPA: hypothetical protein VGP64_18285 [Polyangia bacterium]|jgi:hypothetical protein
MECFRVSVRAVEAWLLADGECLASFLSVNRRHIPSDPDVVLDPKRAIVDLAKKSSRREIREDIAPRPGTTPKVGPAYAARMIEFANRHWRPDIAAQHSRSLERFVAAVSVWR